MMLPQKHVDITVLHRHMLGITSTQSTSDRQIDSRMAVNRAQASNYREFPGSSSEIPNNFNWVNYPQFKQARGRGRAGLPLRLPTSPFKALSGAACTQRIEIARIITGKQSFSHSYDNTCDFKNLGAKDVLSRIFAKQERTPVRQIIGRKP